MDLSRFSLEHKVAVVTGGNGGIGLAMATGLARAGADVAIWARNAAKSEAAVASLLELGGRAVAIECDVADEGSVGAATAATVDSLGRIDVVIANAGVHGTGRFPTDFSLEEWDRVYDINVNGAFLTVRATTAQMIAQGGGGSVIITGSIGGILGIAQAPHYSSSKAAAIQMTRAFAVALARHRIRVNAIAPGFIRTEMTEESAGNAKFEEVMINLRTPMRRWGETDDFEGPAVFLASDASAFMTGTTTVVDGGLLIS
jgi:NAD(P)-dependent dehydrogenase (short-subunit alcohol dehydrogenase family)